MMLLAGYVIILALEILLLVFSVRRNTKKYWLGLFASEVASVAVAFGLGCYYDSLPGYGFMPGLTYLAETLLSYGAGAAYGLVLLISVIICIVRAKK